MTAFIPDIPFVNDIGIEFLEAADGRARIALDVLRRHTNSWNTAHGGVVMTLLDVAMAIAGRSLDPEARGGVTIEMKTSFMQPAGGEGQRLIATGTALHRSTTMVFCEAEVRRADGALVAKSMGTFKYNKRSDAAAARRISDG